MKTALITGASAGIGKETAKVYAKNGYHLVLTARRENLLQELKAEILSLYPNTNVLVFATDLAKLHSAEQLFEKIKADNLKIDVLINNAGFGLYDEFLNHNPEKLEQMLVLNIVALTQLSQLFGKEMVKNGGGNIINIASTAAFQPMPKLAVYAATKAYVMNFSDAIAYELKDKNITVTCINPGATNSEFAKVANFTSEVAVNPKNPSSEDLAEFIYQAMVQQKTNVIHGLQNAVMAFGNRFVSRKISTYIAAKKLE